MKKSKNPFSYQIKKIRWPLGCLLFFISACNNNVEIASLQLNHADSIVLQEHINHAYREIAVFSKQIQNGDLVTRTGNDFTSESLRSLNQTDKTYSHCGIACVENDSVFVYHAMGGEFNPDQKLLKESITQFAEPYSNRGIGLYRFNLSENTIAALLDSAKASFDKGLKFDMDFDLKTDERMYCAEFVSKTYQKAAGSLLSFHKSHIGTFEFVGVDDLFLHKRCAKVTSVVYK